MKAAHNTRIQFEETIGPSRLSLILFRAYFKIVFGTGAVVILGGWAFPYLMDQLSQFIAS